MVLDGIFLGRPEDAPWLFESGGAKRLFPDYYQRFLQALPQSIHSNIITGAPRIMTGDDRHAATVKIGHILPPVHHGNNGLATGQFGSHHSSIHTLRALDPDDDVDLHVTMRKIQCAK